MTATLRLVALSVAGFCLGLALAAVVYGYGGPDATTIATLVRWVLRALVAGLVLAVVIAAWHERQRAAALRKGVHHER